GGGGRGVGRGCGPSARRASSLGSGAPPGLAGGGGGGGGGGGTPPGARRRARPRRPRATRARSRGRRPRRDRLDAGRHVLVEAHLEPAVEATEDAGGVMPDGRRWRHGVSSRAWGR